MKLQSIRIPACAEHQGFHVLQVDVPWNCIYCGAARGDHQTGFSHDGSRRLKLSMWDNPCGRVETYESIRIWLQVQREIADHSSPPPSSL
jgi:hypothetical protein